MQRMRVSLFLGLALWFAASAEASIALPGGIQATQAWQFSFENYQVATGDVDLSAQLHMYVFKTNGDSRFDGKINFLFTNDAVEPSNICEIWFSDGAYLAPPLQIVSSSGVSYTTTPEGGTDRPPQISDWVTTAYTGAVGDLSPERTKNGGVKNGCDNSSEWLVISFDFVVPKTFDDVIEGLTQPPNTNNPLFRVALHVQTLNSPAGSDTWIVGDGEDLDPPPPAPPVPEPATLAIWSLGLGIAGLVRLRREK